MIGALLTQLAETRRDNRQLARERQARDLERSQSRHDRREAFELTHLEDVHAKLTDLFAKATISREAQRVGEDDPVAAELMALNRAVTSVVGLILQDDVRALAEEAHSAANLLTIRAATGDSSTETFIASFQKLTAAQAAIAGRLRQIYQATPP